MSSFIWGIVWFTAVRTWIAICMNSRRSYLKQIGQKGSKVCQKHVMQISLILSPNYLLNVPPDARKGKLLMNVANEEGGEVSWSLAEIWQFWDKKGRTWHGRRGHLAISPISADLTFPSTNLLEISGHWVQTGFHMKTKNSSFLRLPNLPTTWKVSQRFDMMLLMVRWVADILGHKKASLELFLCHSSQHLLL